MDLRTSRAISEGSKSPSRMGSAVPCQYGWSANVYMQSWWTWQWWHDMLNPCWCNGKEAKAQGCTFRTGPVPNPLLRERRGSQDCKCMTKTPRCRFSRTFYCVVDVVFLVVVAVVVVVVVVVGAVVAVGGGGGSTFGGRFSANRLYVLLICPYYGGESEHQGTFSGSLVTEELEITGYSCEAGILGCHQKGNFWFD